MFKKIVIMCTLCSICSVNDQSQNCELLSLSLKRQNLSAFKLKRMTNGDQTASMILTMSQDDCKLVQPSTRMCPKKTVLRSYKNQYPAFQFEAACGNCVRRTWVVCLHLITQKVLYMTKSRVNGRKCFGRMSMHSS